MTGTPTTPGISSLSTTVSGLTQGTPYSWRVRSNNGSTTSAWSSTATFTVYTSAAPVVPSPGSPINGVEISTTKPDISWYLTTAPIFMQKYKLEISESENFSTLTLDLDNIESLTKNVDGLTSGKTYYWRVSSKDEKGNYSSYSREGKFKISSVTGIGDETFSSLIPDKFEVSQNYPNPFNPSTTIKFGLPEAAFVSIKIYNILGQEVKTLLNAERSAGTYTLQWNGDNNFGHQVTSGTYIYRVVAGNNVVTKKMILLK